MRPAAVPGAAGNFGNIQTGPDTTWHFVVVDDILLRQTGLPTKVIALQLLQWQHDASFELRLGYYQWSADMERWYWSRNTPMLPVGDFAELSWRARKKWPDSWSAPEEGLPIVPLDSSQLDTLKRTAWKKRWGG